MVGTANLKISLPPTARAGRGYPTSNPLHKQLPVLPNSSSANHRGHSSNEELSRFKRQRSIKLEHDAIISRETLSIEDILTLEATHNPNEAEGDVADRDEAHKLALPTGALELVEGVGDEVRVGHVRSHLVRVLRDLCRGKLKVGVDGLVHDGGERRANVVDTDNQAHDGGLTTSLSDLHDEQLRNKVVDAAGDFSD
ncbi:hypothetical protein ON010_g17653 [Phytophthora cinnamomi]|nr:hypothetical protein ON010_g17653 [Phytophthora cinnamomi]